jgi:hypothetical protein
MKHSNRTPLLSRDIHEKLANTIIIALILSVKLVALFRDLLMGVYLIVGFYAVSVLNTRYPRPRGKDF